MKLRKEMAYSEIGVLKEGDEVGLSGLLKSAWEVSGRVSTK
jgi:hypothetical protein